MGVYLDNLEEIFEKTVKKSLEQEVRQKSDISERP